LFKALKRTTAILGTSARCAINIYASKPISIYRTHLECVPARLVIDFDHGNMIKIMRSKMKSVIM
jgi:hypothetical protein